METLDAEKFVREKSVGRFSFKEQKEDDTYALRDLKIAGEKKLLWQYIVALGIPNNKKSKYAVYYYYSGKYKSISNPHIFMCREKMQPSRWYYKINEKLPKPVIFTPKFSVDNLMYKESLGHIKFRELQKQYTVQGLADKFDLNFHQIKNILYRRLNPLTGKECFKILPPASVIIKLRDVINPDNWYVFPEEID